MRAEDLHGVWIIRSFSLENIHTGKRSHPWGKRPSGALVFHQDRRMFALVIPDNRLPPKDVHEQATAFQNMLAYSGVYRIDPPNQLVTSVDMSWFESWVGTEQIRYCELRGDDLVLTSAPLSMPQKDGSTEDVFAIVEWTREIPRTITGPIQPT